MLRAADGDQEKGADHLHRPNNHGILLPRRCMYLDRLRFQIRDRQLICPGT